MKKVAAIGLIMVLAAGMAKAEDQPKTDAESIRGTWKVLSAKETNGFEPNLDVPEFQNSVWVFAEQEFTIRQGDRQTRQAYVLDPARKPREIDFGKDLAGKGEHRPFLGIYQLKGNRLAICYTVFNVRPTDFSMGPGIASIKRLVVLERQPE